MHNEPGLDVILDIASIAKLIEIRLMEIMVIFEHSRLNYKQLGYPIHFYTSLSLLEISKRTYQTNKRINK